MIKTILKAAGLALLVTTASYSQSDSELIRKVANYILENPKNVNKGKIVAYDYNSNNILLTFEDTNDNKKVDDEDALIYVNYSKLEMYFDSGADGFSEEKDYIMKTTRKDSKALSKFETNREAYNNYIQALKKFANEKKIK